MKKLTLALVVAAMAGSAVAQTAPEISQDAYNRLIATPADASDVSNRGSAARTQDNNPDKFKGTLTVNGRVVAQTCEIKTGYKHLIVDLETASTRELTQNSHAKQKEFNVKFTNCALTAGAPETKVYAKFSMEDTFFDLGAQAFKNVATADKANNVFVQLLNANGEVIKAGNRGASGATITQPDPHIDEPTESALFRDAISDYTPSMVTLTADDPEPTIKYFVRYYAHGGDAGPGKVQAFTTYDVSYN